MAYQIGTKWRECPVGAAALTIRLYRFNLSFLLWRPAVVLEGDAINRISTFDF